LRGKEIAVQQLKLSIEGMGCGGCVKNVRSVLEVLPGVAVESVAVGSAVLTLDPDRSSPQTVTDALAKAGYPARETGSAPAAHAGGACQGGSCGNPS
jgi:copper chaperone